MEKQLIIFIGIQGSGKTSFYKRYFADRYEHINLDTLHTRNKEKIHFLQNLVESKNIVIDYFLWRQEDAHRNSLNAWCYWTLRKQGFTKRQATQELEGKSIAYKNELLFSYGINYQNLPSWQKRGIGIYRHNVVKEGYNPLKQVATETMRQEWVIQDELFIGDKYSQWLKENIIAIMNA